MYERSAIVLERNMEKMLGFDKTYNLKKNFENFKDFVEEIDNYQAITEEENRIIQEFDDTVAKIESIQKKQEKIYSSNIEYEEERKKYFSDLGENYKTLETKLMKIENSIDNNNKQSKVLRDEFTNLLNDFAVKQKERNKAQKARRTEEKKHLEYIDNITKDFNSIDMNTVYSLKDFKASNKTKVKEELKNLMIKNGKSEKVGFNEEVLKRAIEIRMEIAEREADCYLTAYVKTQRLLEELENEPVKLHKFKKTVRDTIVKTEFFNAEKEYIIGFLDYERMTALSGKKAHERMMEEACKNFKTDIEQIDNLYELILREIATKSTKKGYKELYNNSYLKNIEDKGKNFEREVNNINIRMGTVINSNYWRIEGLSTIYKTFQEQVSNNFSVDPEDLQLVTSDDSDSYENLIENEIEKRVDNKLEERENKINIEKQEIEIKKENQLYEEERHKGIFSKRKNKKEYKEDYNEDIQDIGKNKEKIDSKKDFIEEYFDEEEKLNESSYDFENDNNYIIQESKSKNKVLYEEDDDYIDIYKYNSNDELYDDYNDEQIEKEIRKAKKEMKQQKGLLNKIFKDNKSSNKNTKNQNKNKKKVKAHKKR